MKQNIIHFSFKKSLVQVKAIDVNVSILTELSFVLDKSAVRQVKNDM